MRQRDLQHGSQGGETHGHELARVGAVVRVHEVHTGQPHVLRGQVVDDFLSKSQKINCVCIVLYSYLHVAVSCEELHLAGAVEHEVGGLVHRGQLRVEPRQVGPHELHGVQQPAVRPQPHRVHHLLHLH